MKLNINVGTKLISGFLAVAAIAGIIGYLGVKNIRVIDNADTMLYERITKPTAYLLDMVSSFHQIRVNLRDMIRAEDSAVIEAKGKRIAELREIINSESAEYEKTIMTDKGKADFADYVKDRAEFRDYQEEMIKLAKENADTEAYAILDGPAGKSANLIEEAVEVMRDQKIAMGKETSDGNTATANAATKMMTIIIFAGIVIALGLGLYLTFSMTTPLKAVVALGEQVARGVLPEQAIVVSSSDEVGQTAEVINRVVESLKKKSVELAQIASGDLSLEVSYASQDDQFARSFDQMLTSLNSVLGQVNGAVSQVSSGSAQVASASQSLSQGASEQAASLEEISASINEIGSQAKQNAENALSANALAKEAKASAENGNLQMKDLVAAMTRINTSAAEIKKIVKAIDDIAFQINLLALNANVEAARAGKYGKGFAVVAEEVRNLATRSADSVKETTRMVEEATLNIAQGNELVAKTAGQLGGIVEGSGKVVSLVEEIAAASKEQAQGLEQINRGLVQIDQVTQSNTASAEQSSSASEELAGQAGELKSLVAKFKLSQSHGAVAPTEIKHLTSRGAGSNGNGRGR